MCCTVQRWSDRLAQLAQDWADRCSWGHRPTDSYNPQDYGFSSIGENIWAWSVAGVKNIPDDPIQDWFDEKQYYIYDSGQCTKEPCGHYTTVRTSLSYQLGYTTLHGTMHHHAAVPCRAARTTPDP